MSAAGIDEVRTEAQRHWDELASKARRSRRAKDVSLFTFLIAVSIPVIVPYFWLLTLAFSAGVQGVDTKVLWPSILILVPAVVATWVWATLARTRREALTGWGVIWLVTIALYVVIVGPNLHLYNFRFLYIPEFNTAYRENRRGGRKPRIQPDVVPFRVVGFLELALHRRCRHADRSDNLHPGGLLHIPFPVPLPRFLAGRHAGTARLSDDSSADSNIHRHVEDRSARYLDRVMLVIVGIEMPFAVFIMKGFFDAVPWEIEMSALTDGATRRQAFIKVVLPQVSNGMIAVRSSCSFAVGKNSYSC